MEVNGIVIEVVERPNWLRVKIYTEDKAKDAQHWIRCVPKRFDVNFGDYLSMNPESLGDALWARAAAATEGKKNKKLTAALLPFLEVDSNGKMFENGKMVGHIKKRNTNE